MKSKVNTRKKFKYNKQHHYQAPLMKRNTTKTARWNNKKKNKRKDTENR